MIGKYCGNAIFPTIHSSGSSLWFKYVTAAEGRTLGRNYDLFYTSTDQGMGCGGTLYNTRGVVTSPNFPQAYAQLSNCQWTLKVPPGQKIELRFTRKEKILRHFFSGFASSAASSLLSHAAILLAYIMQEPENCVLITFVSSTSRPRDNHSLSQLNRS